MTQAAHTILISGGVRSGKSAYALFRACELGERRTFIATAEAFDDEMRERALRHRAERGTLFRTLEAPRELVRAVHEASGQSDVIVIDCLTLWLSNLLLTGLGQTELSARVRELCEQLRGLAVPVIIVSNEVGMGVVPDSPLGRAFRDASGSAHQLLAEVADELYFAVMGQLLRLRPAPIELAVTHVRR